MPTDNRDVLMRRVGAMTAVMDAAEKVDARDDEAANELWQAGVNLLRKASLLMWSVAEQARKPDGNP